MDRLIGTAIGVDEPGFWKTVVINARKCGVDLLAEDGAAGEPEHSQSPLASVCNFLTAFAGCGRCFECWELRFDYRLARIGLDLNRDAGTAFLKARAVMRERRRRRRRRRQ